MELYASLASYVAGATGDGKYEGETTKLLGQSNYYGVLDLFGSEIPSILTKLLGIVIPPLAPGEVGPWIAAACLSPAVTLPAS